MSASNAHRYLVMFNGFQGQALALDLSLVGDLRFTRVHIRFAEVALDYGYRIHAKHAVIVC